MALWYFDCAEFNETGVRPTVITIWAVTFGSIKRTCARVIILMVSMGVRCCETYTWRVYIKGYHAWCHLCCFWNSWADGKCWYCLGKARLFSVLPVAILDAFFIIWMFKKPQTRRLLVKLDVYRKVTNALAVASLLSVGWFCYEPTR